MNQRLSRFSGRIAGALLGAVLLRHPGHAGAAADPPHPPAAPAAVPAVARPATKPSPYAAFETFAIIGERNIFNPNRTGRSPRNPNTPPPAADILTLVGTMDYEKGLFAFFDGSQPAFRQALRVGGVIGRFTVTAINGNGAELARDGQKFPLGIGQQLRRPVGGDWKVLSPDAAQRIAGNTAAADEPAAPPAIPADASEVLKRLMQQRLNQLKQ